MSRVYFTTFAFVVMMLQLLFCGYFFDSSYADWIANQIEGCTNLRVLIRLMLPNVDTIDQAEEAMWRGALFVVVLTERNQLNNAITVDILHGQPEGISNLCVRACVAEIPLRVVENTQQSYI